MGNKKNSNTNWHNWIDDVITASSFVTSDHVIDAIAKDKQN
jgi:hypothetical protein